MASARIDDYLKSIWRRYHAHLKSNLGQVSQGNSWAFTPQEWSSALIAVRDKIRDDFYMIDHGITATEWQEYFDRYPERINRGDYDHKITPLIVSVILGRNDFCEILMRKGADPDLETEEGESARTLATHYADPAILEILKQYPAPTLLTSWDLAD